MKRAHWIVRVIEPWTPHDSFCLFAWNYREDGFKKVLSRLMTLPTLTSSRGTTNNLVRGREIKLRRSKIWKINLSYDNVKKTCCNLSILFLLLPIGSIQLRNHHILSMLECQKHWRTPISQFQTWFTLISCDDVNWQILGREFAPPPLNCKRPNFHENESCEKGIYSILSINIPPAIQNADQRRKTKS